MLAISTFNSRSLGPTGTPPTGHLHHHRHLNPTKQEGL